MRHEHGIINKCLDAFSNKILRGQVNIVSEFVLEEFLEKSITGVKVGG